MSVTLEKIDMLMSRANISYKEAKEALERHDGDLVEALIDLESVSKVNKPGQGSAHQGQYRDQERAWSRESRNQERAYRHHGNEGWEQFKKGAKETFHKLNVTNLRLSSREKVYLDIPMIAAVIFVLFTLPFSLILLVLPYCFGMRFDIMDSKQGQPEPKEPSPVDAEAAVKQE